MHVCTLDVGTRLHKHVYTLDVGTRSHMHANTLDVACKCSRRRESAMWVYMHAMSSACMPVYVSNHPCRHDTHIRVGMLTPSFICMCLCASMVSCTGLQVCTIPYMNMCICTKICMQAYTCVFITTWHESNFRFVHCVEYVCVCVCQSLMGICTDHLDAVR
jgi:hypothetical protein